MSRMSGRRSGEKGEWLALVLKAGLAVLAAAALMTAAAGCGEEAEPIGDPVGAYLAVIRELENPETFNEDGAVSMIAVDTRNMAGLSDREAKERFFTELEELYHMEVMDKNQIRLARDGYLEDNRFEGGLLFVIKEEDPYESYAENPVRLHVMEWGRGDLTLLEGTCQLEYGGDGAWTVTETAMEPAEQAE